MNMLDIRVGVVPELGCGYRLELTGYRSLEVPGPGAVAHMSLHQKPTMSKSRQTVIADSAWFPDFIPGDRLSEFVGDRSVVAVAVEAVSAASVEPIYEGFVIRSTAFCNFISLGRKNRRIPRFFPYLGPLESPSRDPESAPRTTNQPIQIPNPDRESAFRTAIRPPQRRLTA